MAPKLNSTHKTPNNDSLNEENDFRNGGDASFGVSHNFPTTHCR